MGASKSAGDGGSKDHRTQRGKEPPKKSVTTRVIDAGKDLITARRKTAYNTAKIIPGEDKRLRKNRTDYKNYLTSKGSTPDFLQDDKNLTSFETYDKLINYNPTSSHPVKKAPLNYADYLAEEKGNYNLQRSGNVGGMNETGEGRNNQLANTIIKKNIGGNTIQTTAPTEAEVSQSEAANADAAALKVKKRGRSASIMTGPKGVTKTSTDYSLGKKSLLGRV